MKKEYIKPEVDLIDLSSKERLMNLDDEAILFGDHAYLEAEKELSNNFFAE